MSKGFKVSIENWTVQLKPKIKKVVICKDSEEIKKISIDKFEQHGMILFPKQLYKTIIGSLRNSNTYDRLMDRFYEYLDGEAQDVLYW